jgi:transposase
MSSIAVGIDVAKDFFLISINQAKAFEVKNKESDLLRFIAKLPKNAICHMEASGGYERKAVSLLRKAQIEVRVHNPLKVKRLAQGLGFSAKTDALDAVMLGKVGPMLSSTKPKSEERMKLTELSRTIDSLRDTCTKFKLEIQTLDPQSYAHRVLKKAIEENTTIIEEAKAGFLAMLKETAHYTDYKLLLSTPGIGPETARILICELPEDVKTSKSNSMASYAGLAPLDHSSGKSKGKARIFGGNTKIRTALYMPALVVIRTENWATETYAKHKASGKPHQLIMVAIMRKLLLRAVAVIKRGTKYEKIKQPT